MLDEERACRTGSKQMTMSKGKHALIGLGIAIVICSVYARFFGLQTFLMWKTSRVGRQQPVVWITPAQLVDLSLLQGPRTRLSYFGYEFEVPWDDIDHGKTRVAGTGSAIIAFRSGNVIIFRIGPPKGLVSDLSRDGIDRISLGRLLGDEAAQSDYDFERAILEATPDKLSLLMPKSRDSAGRFVIDEGQYDAKRRGIGHFPREYERVQGISIRPPSNPSKKLES